MDTPESSASLPPLASEEPPKRSSRYGRIFVLVVLIAIEAAGWGWAQLSAKRATMIYFGDSRCFVFDLQPRCYVIAFATYSLPAAPILGKGGDGWTRWVNPANQPFVTDANTRLGFGFGQWKDDGYGGIATYGRIPHYALLTALVLMLGYHCWRSYRYVAPGCCKRCGYDLRATPDRCPECGAVPAPPVHV